METDKSEEPKFKTTGWGTFVVLRFFIGGMLLIGLFKKIGSGLGRLEVGTRLIGLMDSERQYCQSYIIRQSDLEKCSM